MKVIVELDKLMDEYGNNIVESSKQPPGQRFGRGWSGSPFVVVDVVVVDG